MKAYTAQIIATFFGIGLLPKAPGTWGSLAGFVVSMFFFTFKMHFALMIACVFFAFIGLIASTIHAQELKQKDPQQIVIDEVSGLFIGLSVLVIFDYWILEVWVLCFFLFRLADILKPWPINKLQDLPNGLGIMADDWVAGLLAGVLSAVGWGLYSNL